MSRNMITKAMATAVLESNDKITASVDEVQMICESLLVHVLEEAKAGKEVAFTNFLKFKRVLNKARTFRRPGTEDTTEKPERYSLSVKVMTNTKVAFEKLPVSGGEESGSEEKPAKKGKKAAAKKSDDEVEEKPAKVAKGKAAAKKSDEVEEEKPAKAVKGKAAAKKSDDEKEKPKAVKAKGKAAAAKAVLVNELEKSDGEEPKDKKNKAKKGAAAVSEIEEVADDSDNEFMFD